MRGSTWLYICVLALAGCSNSSTIRTSADTALIQTSAAPICGSTGAARTAERRAAIETIKAGFDRYIIYSGQSANNVSTTRMPGTAHTTGNIRSGGGFNATTVYMPGPIVRVGSHDQSLAIKMFRNSDPGADQAISARDVLGPNWEKLVKSGAFAPCA